MRKVTLLGILGMALWASPAAALCTSYPNTLTNGTTADATQVMANFNCAALTSGSTINGLTLTGATTFPGSTTVTSTGSVGIGLSSPNELLVVGYGPEALSGTYAAVGSTSTNSGLLVGQGAGRNLVSRWVYNATPANAFGQIYTGGYANQLQIDG